MKMFLSYAKNYLLVVLAFFILLIYNPWADNLAQKTAIQGLSVSLALMMFFIPIKYRRLVFLLLALPCCLTYLIIFENQILLGIPLSYEIAVSILSSNWRESTEFIGHFSGIKMFATAIYAFLPLLLVFLIDVKNTISFKKYFYWFILAFFSIEYFMAMLIVFHFEGNYLFEVASSIIDINKKEMNTKSKNLTDIIDLDPKSENKTYVVLISDSVGPQYMSLYGFNIKNTPFLESIKSEIYAFDNVTTKYNFTYEVLERFLTFSEDHQDQEIIREKGTLVDFYKDAGFKVYWISSHPQYGFTNSFSYLMANADEKSFRCSGEDDSTDAILLPKFDKALSNPSKKKIIFVHFQGAHYKYSDRYPENYNKDYTEFKMLEKGMGIEKKYVEYLRAIMFQDELLKRIFGMIEAKENSASFVLFLSDHAEDVDPKGDASFSHGGMMKPRVMEVPLILWMSDLYKKNNPDIVSAVRKNLHRPYETNLFHNSLLDLSRFSHPYIDETKSIFNKKFIERHRFYDDLKAKDKTR